jgi:hypothetical protein
VPANRDQNRISAVARLSTQIFCNEPLTISIGSLRFSMAAGYLPASLVYASHFNTTRYNVGNGGGGNCTRVSGFRELLRNVDHAAPPVGGASYLELRPDGGRGLGLDPNWGIRAETVRVVIAR